MLDQFGKQDSECQDSADLLNILPSFFSVGYCLKPQVAHFPNRPGFKRYKYI